MQMKSASTLFLAAVVVGGVSCQLALQDVPVVGVDTMSPPTTSTSEAESSSTKTAAEKELVEALEFDDHVTGKKQWSVPRLGHTNAR